MGKPRKIKFKNLAGSWAVVTGASSGIGLEYSRFLASKGCNVLMVSNQGKQLEACRLELSGQFPTVRLETLDLDLSTPTSADVLCDKLGTMGIVPLLFINNAGIFNLSYFSDLPESRLDLYINLHIRTVTLLTRKVAAMMEKAGRGYILNMSSMAAWLPMPGIAMYSATKAYLYTLTRALHTEWRDRGVSLTAVCPGAVATTLFGLRDKLLKLGVRLGVIVRPKKFVRRAVRKTLRCKSTYVNGWYNNVAIPLVDSLPEWFRVWGKKKLLGK